MALVVNLRSVENLQGKADRLTRCTFRDNTLHSKVVRSAKNAAYFGESFEWPIARPVEPEECLAIELLNHNKYFSDKVLGTLAICLQQVIKDGTININEPFIDGNNRITQEVVNIEVKYYSPDGRVGDWNTDQFSYPLIQDVTEGADPETLKGQLPDALNETASLRTYENGRDKAPGEDTASLTMMTEQMYQVKKKRPEVLEHELHKPRDFSISITVIEGMQLSGLDIDPVIRVQVGDQFRYTTIKKSTNNPYYNEFFAFDFFESPAMIFDKMITIRAMHALGLPGRQVLRAGNLVAGRMIGEFKCDVGTVYAGQDHMYYHKWAVLIHPKEGGDGPKGFIKCDISVLGKGDVVRAQKHNLKDDDTHDVAANLLLPAGVPMERQRANYQMIIYRAEDLPRTNLGLLASVKKAMGGAQEAFIDAMVKIHFAGQVCKTSSKKQYHPEWQEIITFSDMFPPLCNRIKIELCDNDVTKDEVIATHFIELSQIMDPGSDSDGILPTFGPTWINFYGAPRNYKMLEEHEDLNAGLGEGAAFRGRLLLEIKTEIQDEEGSAQPTVYREPFRSSSAVQVAPRKQFLLFGTIMEATMIDKELAGKNVHFEISIGNFGNALDARAGKSLTSDDADSESGDDEGEESRLVKQKKTEEANLPCYSTTPPTAPKPMTDNNYNYMPFEGEKPCTYVVSVFEDLRKRMYHSNLLEAIHNSIEEGLEDVRQMVKDEYENSHQRLRGVLGDFTAAISNYLRLLDGLQVGAGSGKTKLDKFRIKMCKSQLDKIKSSANDIKGHITKENVKEKYRESKDLARKVKHLIKEPQHCLPDVFVWLVSDKKRIAYSRIPAKDLLHATQDTLKGKNCGKIQSLFLKKPGKKSTGASGWVMQAKVDMYLWLGQYEPTKSVMEYLSGLPPGYKLTEDVSKGPLPPKVLVYPEVHTFQLRSYLFQARSLLGSDDTGLSDPFARIIISNHCKASQVIEQTLSPTWNETLVFDDVKVYGPIDHIKKLPPLVICEVFDYDFVGKPEFLGRAFVKVKVKSEDMTYDVPEFPPQLEWFDVYRGARAAGELLGSFELLEGPTELNAPLPEVVPSKCKESIKIIPLPQTIMPVLSRYRVEVMFWGLRELRRVQLLSVDRPKVEIEIGGHAVSCRRIEDIQHNCNFEDNLYFMDVDLPDNRHYWPPITIRVMDCRQFGREVLVGTHAIGDSPRYLRDKEEEEDRGLAPALMALKGVVDNILDPAALGALDWVSQHGSVVGSRIVGSGTAGNGDVVLNIPEGAPLESASVVVIMETGGATTAPDISGSKMGSHSGSMRGSRAATLSHGEIPSVAFAKPDVKQPLNGHLPGKSPAAKESEKDNKDKKKKKKKDVIAELDWWSKYYVTKEDLTKEQRMKKKRENKQKDLFPNVVEYEGIDEHQLAELRELADQKRIEEEEAEDSKGGAKSKKKKNARKALNALKGVVNKGFTKDEDGGTVPLTEYEMEDKSHIQRIKVYETELEKVRAFDGFEDMFETFTLFYGKLDDDADDEETRVAGKFKGKLCVYRVDPKDSDDLTSVLTSSRIKSLAIKPGSVKALQHAGGPALRLSGYVPNPKPFEVQVLVYIIKCIDLYPTDANGKIDPYLYIKCGKNTINDKENRHHNQLNPVFGKMFEISAAFPMDSYLRIQVYDYDLLGSDDMIGETVIDLENRYYSRHRATCGIPETYDLFGYNVWRDPQKPTQIVAKLCKELRLDPPDYKASSVRMCGKTYQAEPEVETEAGELQPTQEHLALEVLKHWQDVPGGCKLVPEHIETRALYNPLRPGVEQGRMEMWIDMFPKDMPPPTTTVDITPRLPKGYELRVIIWNTDEVVLQDENFLTGEASSDIFVKGYLKGVGEDDQSTDVHYRSLTGEGNFNWRYLFPFDYLKAEEKIMYKKRTSIFDLEESEVKVPPKLTIQVWDADLISSDDFLGSITMDLNRIPRPAKDAKHCKIGMLKTDGSVPHFNIFKQKQTKGWWPMAAKGGEEGYRIVGKVEAELILMTAEEAEKQPAGKGRDEPDPLPEPNRPDNSFLWLLNPWKTLRYVLWRNYKWLIIKIIIIILIIAFIGLLLYSMPGATIDKLFGLGS